MNKARQELCQSFINTLKQGDIPWENVFQDSRCPSNAVTGTEYLGLNSLILQNEALTKGYKSSQWVTASQAKEKGWKLKEGEAPVLLEMTVMQEKANLKNMISVYSYMQKVLQDASEGMRYQKTVRVYAVYNLEQYSNIPAGYGQEKKKEKRYNSEFVKNLPVKLGVKLTSDMAAIKKMWPELKVPKEISAFYLEETDIIYLPKREDFKSEYDYHAIQLHEMCHATADRKRLNRSELRAQNTGFGSPGYAKEELRAEIASAFLMQDIGLKADKKKLTNHRAYIQSWIRVLENSPEELERAIEEAFQIEEYMLKTGEYDKYRGRE